MRLRRVLFVTFLALAVPVAAASLAYACTALATLTVTSGAAAPGSTVTGTGKGFNGGGHGTPAGSTPVELRFNTRGGTVLTTAVPLDAAGNIAFSFVAPNVPPGQYVLIGVQTNPVNGTPFYGTPARQSLTIVAGTARSSAGRGESVGAPVSAAEPEATTAPAASGGPAAAGTTGSAAARPGPALGAAASLQVADSPAAAAAVQATPPLASGGEAAGPASGGGQSPAGPSDPGSGGLGGATMASSAAAADPAPVTIATPGLVPAASLDRGSVLPAVVLIVLGLGIALAASGRLLTTRLPLRRSPSVTAT